ncbi:thiamine-phosphate kinase [Thermincola potens]|uniref:Thiamine-monophosphate kinase n=1 Tax=Thermincola potens (strain JR) TaxID=635013 RepID=D5XCG8_THEPJ|nr:thiamine-phosphate kinase [Thermincola potens]ADG81594.1 thiamine-monophosphate kinase [Thermincola potens JR]
MKIAEIGEFGLIKRISSNLEFRRQGLIMGIGDDTAVFRPGEGKWLLMTTDMLVEGIHFSGHFASYEQIGWKAVVVNVSDIAAMGGIPACATVSIGIPPQLELEAVEEIYRGMRKAARTYELNIVGGDTVKCPPLLVINVTLVGEADEGKVIYRSGAAPGDIICVTGPLGGSAAGLQLLLNRDLECPEEARREALSFHLEPQARVKEGLLLSREGLATSMNDISDGLASELHEISQASNTGFVIDYDLIPIADATKAVAKSYGTDPVHWALYGGEDFELVFTVKPRALEKVERLFAKCGFSLYRIGHVTEKEKGYLMRGGPGGEIQISPRGYNHFTE